MGGELFKLFAVPVILIAAVGALIWIRLLSLVGKHLRQRQHQVSAPMAAESTATGVSCSACSNEAVRKCTRCGQVYCELHTRYGNPQRGLAGLFGGIGHYCDGCWSAVGRRSLIEYVVAALLLVAAFILVGWAILRMFGGGL